MAKFGVFFASVLASTVARHEAFVVPSSSHHGHRLSSLTALSAAAANDGNEAGSSSPNTNPKKQRPDTSLQMSDTTLEHLTEEQDLVQAGDSFQNLMQGILTDQDAVLTQDDIRLLKLLLKSHAEETTTSSKNKFEQDAYWEEVRKPVNEATTIPPEVFRSAEFYKLEQEKILAKTWVCVGTSDQVRHVGDVISVAAAGQPVIVSRAKDGVVRGFYNACRHRGARLVSEQESGKKHTCISCPYHNWGYGLDGKLLATPHWNTNADGHKNSKAGRMMAASGVVENFNKEENGLHPVRTEIWGPFIYVNLSGDAPPIDEYLGRVTTDLEAFPFDDLVTVMEDKFEVQANWKLLAENYIDFYHLATVHPDYAQVSRPDDHVRAQGDGMYAGYVTYPLSNAGTPLDLDRFPIMKNLKGTKHEVTGWYQIHFPNMFFFLLPHSLFMVMLEPTGVGSSVEHCRLLVDKDSLAEAGDTAEKAIKDMWDYYFTVNTEDFEICQKTQIGIAAEVFTGGRMVYAYEESLNRYHKMIANCMTGNPFDIPAGDEVPSYYDRLPVHDYKKYEDENAEESS